MFSRNSSVSAPSSIRDLGRSQVAPAIPNCQSFILHLPFLRKQESGIPQYRIIQENDETSNSWLSTRLRPLSLGYNLLRLLYGVADVVLGREFGQRGFILFRDVKSGNEFL